VATEVCGAQADRGAQCACECAKHARRMESRKLPDCTGAPACRRWRVLPTGRTHRGLLGVWLAHLCFCGALQRGRTRTRGSRLTMKGVAVSCMRQHPHPRIRAPPQRWRYALPHLLPQPLIAVLVACASQAATGTGATAAVAAGTVLDAAAVRCQTGHCSAAWDLAVVAAGDTALHRPDMRAPTPPIVPQALQATRSDKWRVKHSVAVVVSADHIAPGCILIVDRRSLSHACTCARRQRWVCIRYAMTTEGDLQCQARGVAWRQT
jgi:hypothetical protein